MPECVNGWLRIVPSMRQLLPRWNGAIVMRSKETHFKFIGCLFIIYFRSKVFEYKKRSIKILVYSSVIDIDQMAGCDLFCSNFYERFVWGASLFSLFRFQAPLWGFCMNARPPPPWGIICSFSKTKWQMPDKCPGDGHAWNWPSHNTSKKIFGTHIRHSGFFHKTAN